GRRDLRRILATFPGVRVVVTHDPLEAAALADRLIVIEGGRIVQTGTAAELAVAPRSTYVAELAGTNLFTGTAHGDRVHLDRGSSLAIAAHLDGPVFVLVQPRAVALSRHRPDGSPRNVWPATIDTVE